jgi:HlyD family secretion protein
VEPTASDDLQETSLTPLEVSPLQDADLFDDALSPERTGLKWIMGSGLVAIVGIGGWLGYQAFLRSPSEPIAVSTASVSRDDLEVVISEGGIVELGGQQTFKAPSDVTVQSVLVEERQQVSQGQVLLKLRNRQLQQSLADKIVQARINQLDLQRKQEILAEKQLRVQDATERLADSQDLLAQGYISEDDFRTDKRDLENAQSELRTAEVELIKAELQVEQDQISLETIQLQLADNQIVSPIDAIVLKVDVKPGDGVEREGRLLSIGDPNQEVIRLDLPTLNAAKVGIGQPVRVSVIGPNPEVFEGQIVGISPQAIGESDNAEQATVEAEAKLKQPSRSLIPGSAVNVDIVLEQRQDVLAVPVTAIQREGSQPYVWVKDADNTARKREVTLGLETLEAVEIVAGLQIDDEIVVSLPPDAELAEGQPLGTSEGEDTSQLPNLHGRRGVL